MNMFNPVDNMLYYFDYLELSKIDPTDRSTWPGIYGSVKLTDKTRIKLFDYYKNYITNLEPQHKFHITTIFTKNIIPLQTSRLTININPNTFSYEQFGDNKQVLVLRVEHPMLHKIFNKAISFGATWDFPSYKPHITLSTDFSSSIKTLPTTPPFYLYTTRNVIEPLDDE